MPCTDHGEKILLGPGLRFISPADMADGAMLPSPCRPRHTCSLQVAGQAAAREEGAEGYADLGLLEAYQTLPHHVGGEAQASRSLFGPGISADWIAPGGMLGSGRGRTQKVDLTLPQKPKPGMALDCAV